MYYLYNKILTNKKTHAIYTRIMTQKEINPKILQSDPKMCLGVMVPVLNDLVVEVLNKKPKNISTDIFFTEFRTRFLKKIKDKIGIIPQVSKIEFDVFVGSCSDLHYFDRHNEYQAVDMTLYDYIQYMYAHIQKNNFDYIEEKETESEFGCKNVSHYQKQAMLASSQFIGTSDKYAIANAFSSKQSVEIADKKDEKNVFEKLHDQIKEKGLSTEDLRKIAEDDDE
jgi:hypothetical protein